ncbi:MAG: amidase [Vicinamibacterales bacterium]
MLQNIPPGSRRRRAAADQPRTIHALGRALRRRRLTARDATERCLERIARHDPRLHAFVTVSADTARAAAEQADEELGRGIDRGPLHGVPVSLKDLIDVAGVRTSAASRITEGHVAERDAVLVERLRTAGAVIVGKTNLHEFAFGTTNEDSAAGAARNPWDLGRSPGGSSGGSAISVATGMAFGSIGTDTGGSVRIPAAACGVVGMKPAYGELPSDGIVPLAPTLDHPGVLARSVLDAFLLFGVLRGVGRTRRLVKASLVNVRFGVLHRYFCDVLDKGVSDRFDEVLSVLNAARSQLVERTVPNTDAVMATFVNLQAPEAYVYHAATLKAHAGGYTPAVRARIERGASIPATAYVEARQARAAFTKAVDALFEDVDVLLLPTLPIPAPPLGAEDVIVNGKPEAVRGLMLKMTQLFNITGHPAISIPCGRTPEGLPIGLQLVGSRDRTLSLLELAAGCEALLERSEGRRGVDPEQDGLLV